MINERIAVETTLIAVSSAKAERQNDQKIDITPGDNLIDRELQVKRTRNHKGFEDNGKDQDLDERVCAAAQLCPEGRKREPCSFVLGEKTLRWRKLERDTGQVLRGLGNWKEPLA